MPPPTILCHTLMHRARAKGSSTSTIWCGRRTCWRRPLPDARGEVCSGLAAEVRILDPFQSQKVTKKTLYIYIYSDLKCHFRTLLLILFALVQKVKKSRKGYKMIQDDTRSSWKATGGSHANLPTGSGWKLFVHLFIHWVKAKHQQLSSQILHGLPLGKNFLQYFMDQCGAHLKFREFNSYGAKIDLSKGNAAQLQGSWPRSFLPSFQRWQSLRWEWGWAPPASHFWVHHWTAALMHDPDQAHITRDVSNII